MTRKSANYLKISEKYLKFSIYLATHYKKGFMKAVWMINNYG
jgi:hypothetical protein